MDAGAIARADPVRETQAVTEEPLLRHPHFNDDPVVVGEADDVGLVLCGDYAYNASRTRVSSEPRSNGATLIV